MILQIVRRTQFSDATTRESIRVVTHAEDTPSVFACIVYRSRRDHSRPRVYKSFLRDLGPFPFVMEKEKEKKKEKSGPVAVSSSVFTSSSALFLQRVTLTSLSGQTAYILVRTRGAQPSAVIYLSWFEFNGHRHCAYTRVRPACLHFSFLLFRNGTQPVQQSGYRSLEIRCVWCDNATHPILY